jgi:hypothetical protein
LVKKLGRSVKHVELRNPLWHCGGLEDKVIGLSRYQEGTGNRESTPEAGGAYIAESTPEFIDDEEEINSTKTYSQKLRRFLAETIVEHYFILTPRFTEHYDLML